MVLYLMQMFFYIKQIFEIINNYYKLSKICEISIEANPATNINFDELKKIGFNRISIGVQSFIDKELIFLERLHDSNLAIQTITQAKKYFNNINIDLIFSHPNQTKMSLIETLVTATKLDIQHISAYSLIFEENTKLYNLLKNNFINKKSEDEDAELYQIISKFLTKNNYVHYEISNFAKPEFECQHNLNYWKRGEYLGIGTAAHSFIHNRRFSNYNNIYKYCELLSTGVLPIQYSETLTKNEIIEEQIFLGLRSVGINLANFNKNIYNLCRYYENLNYGKIENDIFKLTHTGYFLCDEIAVKLLEII